MKEKKEKLLKHCQDLLYEEAFNMPYDRVKNMYTDNQINRKMDDFLTDLIERGELFYGSNFIEDFIKERTDEARKYLITDLRYGNGIEPVTETNIAKQGSNLSTIQTPTTKSKSVSVSTTLEPIKQQGQKEEKSEVIKEQPKVSKDEMENDIKSAELGPTYESLFNNLVNKCGWPEKVANQVIADGTKNEEIRKQALENLNKQNKEPDITNEGTQKKTPAEDSKNIPAGMKPVVKIKEPKKGLIQKFKEKWQDPKFKRKVIIGGALVAIGVIATVATILNPEFQAYINQFFQNFSPEQINNIDTSAIDGNVLNNVAQSADVSQLAASSIDVSSIDTSSFDPEGMTVYSSASDALTGMNPETANEWFSSNFQGLYDVVNQQVVPLSAEDLQNFDKISELIQNNQNLVPYTGNGELNTLNDVSGFVNIEDVVNHISEGRSR